MNQSPLKVTLTDIVYDLDNGDGDELVETNELPSTIEVTLPESIDNYEDAIDFLSEYITDETGFCHNGFSETPDLEEYFKNNSRMNKDVIYSTIDLIRDKKYDQVDPFVLGRLLNYLDAHADDVVTCYENQELN